MIPSIDYHQIEAGLMQESAKRASRHFKSMGCLLMSGVFDRLFIGEIREQLNEICGDLSNPTSIAYHNALQVGDRRMMIPVPFTGAFNDQRFYANPVLYSFLKDVLGCGFVLNGLGAVVSFPGAADQHIHRDHPMLFGSPVDDFLPPFAVTVIIPLVELNEKSGTTRMWPGSHLMKFLLENIEIPVSERPHIDPTAGPGDCLLMDYRLYHSGLANTSDAIRPILYLIYSRPWFRDSVNYKKHLPLNPSADELERIPDNYRHLFAHSKVH
ncbi:MAG: phytanoyl-CoA dioxygenase family protein [Blastocatellales bacterium]